MADEHQPPEERQKPKGQAKNWALGILVVILALFAITNSQRVEVDYLVSTRDSRLIYVIVICIVLGMLLDRLVIWWRRRD